MWTQRLTEPYMIHKGSVEEPDHETVPDYQVNLKQMRN